MRTTALRVACLGLIVAGSGLIVASAKATDGPREHAQSCSDATLYGHYVFSAEGFDGSTKVAVAGYERYKGDGTFTGLFTISQGGVLQRGQSINGTYHVNPDCSGTETIEGQTPSQDLHFDLFALPSGKQFRWIQTDHGTVLSGDEVKDSD